MKITAEEFEILWELGHHQELEMIVDCHRVAKGDPTAASLIEFGNEFLHELLLDHDVAPNSTVGKLMHNFVAHEAGKYERGTCSRVERLRDLVNSNPVLRGEK